MMPNFENLRLSAELVSSPLEDEQLRSECVDETFADVETRYEIGEITEEERDELYRILFGTDAP